MTKPGETAKPPGGADVCEQEGLGRRVETRLSPTYRCVGSLGEKAEIQCDQCNSAFRLDLPTHRV